MNHLEFRTERQKQILEYIRLRSVSRSKFDLTTTKYCDFFIHEAMKKINQNKYFDKFGGLE